MLGYARLWLSIITKDTLSSSHDISLQVTPYWLIPSLTTWLTCSGNHKQKLYWGHEDIMIPVYKDMSEAFKRHPDADVLVNFASLRSAFEATMETMQYPQVCNHPHPWNCINIFVATDQNYRYYCWRDPGEQD